jgi:hypothetical protein
MGVRHGYVARLKGFPDISRVSLERDEIGLIHSVIASVAKQSWVRHWIALLCSQ